MHCTCFCIFLFRSEKKRQIKFHYTIRAWKHIYLRTLNNVEHFEFFCRRVCSELCERNFYTFPHPKRMKKMSLQCLIHETSYHISHPSYSKNLFSLLRCTLHWIFTSLLYCAILMSSIFFLFPSCCIMYMQFETFLPFAKQILNLSRNVFPVSLFFLFHLVHIILLYFFNAFSHYLMPRFFTRNR